VRLNNAVVLDANILVRAVLGTRVRSLLIKYGGSVQFMVPDSAFAEAAEHVPEILSRRSVAISDGLDVLAALRSTVVRIIGADIYSEFGPTAKRRLARSDLDDGPVLASAFALNAGIAIICLACSIMLFTRGGGSLAMAEEGPHLTAEQAIAAARRNAKPGSSFTVLREIVANADTQRTGDQALEQAQAHKIELYENGLLVNILRSGGVLLAETNPQTNNVIAQHLVFLEPGGAVKDIGLDCHGVLKLSNAEELVKDATEFAEQLYSTPSTGFSSLASRFYGGSFPEGDLFQGTLFAIPNSLQKLGANPNETREAAALYGGYLLWEFRYALSMPTFAASPVLALGAAEGRRDALKIAFLRSNHMDPGIHLDLDNVQSERPLQERIELLTMLDKFLEDALKKEADPTVVRTNSSIAAMPLAIDVDLNQEGQYVSSSPSMLVFAWHRLATGGFAVKEITWDW
jgi:hypothetical protein